MAEREVALKGPAVEVKQSLENLNHTRLEYEVITPLNSSLEVHLNKS